MVFGNRGPDSGTGVLFTRDPATGQRVLYGDVMFGAQGEDVVAGTHHTEPISVLDERMPAVAAELRRYAHALERHYADLCDIEFTIEQGRLWMLQVRVGKRSPQAALRIALEMAEDPDFPLTRGDAVRRVAGLLTNPPQTTAERCAAVPIATGLPASPGVASGEIVTTPEGAVSVAEAGRAAILVRAETSPDDVHGMAKSVGILTSTGGFASHAAVVARGWGIPAVVGAAAVEVSDGVVAIAGRRLAVGATITIDGSTGEVFEGAVAGSSAVVPEAGMLLAWARELGIPIGEAAGEAAGTPAPVTGEEEAMLGPDDMVRLLVVKGYTTPESAGDALLSAPEEASALLDRLVADGLAEIASGSFRLTADGKAVGAEMMAADTAGWGVDRAGAALTPSWPWTTG
jgi:pyruvate,orthophosphate dikinase